MAKKMKLVESKILNRLVKNNRLKFLKEDEIEAADDGAYYLAVDSNSAAGMPEVTVGDGEIYVGPFDSADAAAAAVGDVDMDVAVAQSIDGEMVDASADVGPDMMGGDMGAGVEDDLPMDDLEDEIPMERSKRSRLARLRKESRLAKMRGVKSALARLSIRTLNIEAIRRNFRNALLKETELLGVDTTVAKSDSGVTFNASGALANDGRSAVNQSVKDADKVNPTSDGKRADALPNDDGIEGEPMPKGKGDLDSNGGDLGSLTENYKSIEVNSYVLVKKNGKQIDKGLVESIKGSRVTLTSGGTYDGKDKSLFFIKV